jgi:hypothetical protein|tara:strand:+ start:495 stop:653 length:159 start_codon:yes stop_codon:yes gene_type:complete
MQKTYSRAILGQGKSAFAQCIDQKMRTGAVRFFITLPKATDTENIAEKMPEA